MVHSEGIWNDLELDLEIILKQGRFRVHYDTLWNDIWYCNEKNSTYFDLINVAWSRPAAIIEFLKIGGD